MNYPYNIPTSPPPSAHGGDVPLAPPVHNSPTPPATPSSRVRAQSEASPFVSSPASGPENPPESPTTPRKAPGRFLRTGAIAAASFVVGGAVSIGAYTLGAQGSDTAATAAPASASANGLTPASLDLAAGTAEPAALVAALLSPSVVQVETRSGQGSGVVYAEGLILTNSHVVSGANQVVIRNAQGQVFEVEIVGADTRNDIAVLRVLSTTSDIDLAEALPVAQLGSSAELAPGQLTVAIGSPFALAQTVTAGIVSSTNRPVGNMAGSYSAMIQTDAPINPGNSGGALANRAGEVVGINASIRTDGLSNTNLGIGFAIPIDTAVRVADRLVSGDDLQPGVLGVSGSLDEGIGVPLAEVVDGSAAERAELQPGDRILTINGAPVTSIDELVGLVQANFAGDTVELEVQRDDKQFTVQAVLD